MITFFTVLYLLHAFFQNVVSPPLSVQLNPAYIHFVANCKANGAYHFWTGPHGVIHCDQGSIT